MMLSVLENRITDPSLKLWLPLSYMEGAALASKDAYATPLTPTGCFWTPDGWFFDGIDDCINATAASTKRLDFTTEDFSAIARMKVIDIGGSQYILYRGSWNNGGWLFSFGVTENLTLYTFNAGNVFSKTADGAFSEGGVHTLGFSKKGASVRLYVDGVDLTATVGAHTAVNASNSALGIGDNSLGGVPGSLGGLLKAVAVWKRWLSPLEHAELHQDFKEVFG